MAPARRRRSPSTWTASARWPSPRGPPARACCTSRPTTCWTAPRGRRTARTPCRPRCRRTAPASSPARCSCSTPAAAWYGPRGCTTAASRGRSSRSWPSGPQPARARRRWPTRSASPPGWSRSPSGSSRSGSRRTPTERRPPACCTSPAPGAASRFDQARAVYALCGADPALVAPTTSAELGARAAAEGRAVAPTAAVLGARRHAVGGVRPRADARVGRDARRVAGGRPARTLSRRQAVGAGSSGTTTTAVP